MTINVSFEWFKNRFTASPEVLVLSIKKNPNNPSKTIQYLSRQIEIN